MTVAVAAAQVLGLSFSAFGPWRILGGSLALALLSAAFLFVRHFLMTIVLQYKLHKCAIFAFVYAKTSALPRLMRLTPATCPPKQKKGKTHTQHTAPRDIEESQPFVSLRTSLAWPKPLPFAPLSVLTILPILPGLGGCCFLFHYADRNSRKPRQQQQLHSMAFVGVVIFAKLNDVSYEIRFLDRVPSA